MDLLKSLTIKNLKLNRKRTIVTIIGIMLSVALITAVATMYMSGIYSIRDYEIKRDGNFHVAFYEVQYSDLNEFQNNRDIENIYYTQNVGYSLLEDSKNKYKPYAFIKAYSKDSLENMAVQLVEGRFPESENEILIPTHLKTNGRMELKVGEEITLEVGKRVSDGFELNQDYAYDEENEEKIVDTISKTYKIVGIIKRPPTSVENYHAPRLYFYCIFG